MTRPYPRSWWLAMACVSALAAVAIVCQPAEAGDRWGDEHVKDHLAGEAVIGTVSGFAIKSKPAAFAVALVPGLYREQWKKRHGYDSYSASRLAADIAGAAIGVYVGRCVIADRSITCNVEF